MPLVRLRDVLRDAQKHHYAVPSFNVVTLEMIDAVLRAAERQQSPLIIGLAARHIGVVDPWLIAGAVCAGAAKAMVPVVFHLDHAESVKAIKLGIEIGCTSVMIDGSKLPWQENVALTKEVAAIAHAHNVSVEAELGAVGGVEGEVQGGEALNFYTDPEQARDFEQQTGTDALAVAIGTVHGLYRSAPNLRFDLLTQIAASTRVPLVLHGGSGISAQDFSRLIGLGIRKINVFTELALRNAEKLRENLQLRPAPVGVAEIIGGLAEDLSVIASDLMVIFKSAHRARI
jgi:fructose-bisphosphate aldolase, class II